MEGLTFWFTFTSVYRTICLSVSNKDKTSRKKKITISTKTWTDLLRGPLVMGMLCIFVGNVLKFFRQGDAGKSNVYRYVLIET